MKEKALTISIAAYNVAETLDRCLQSCIDERIIDELDIIVVIDGGTDSSAEIAHSYERQWPNSIRVIEKENGGYGSTVNTSMRLVQGRYYRLLDGDDWLDREGLYQLVKQCRDGNASAFYCDKIIEHPTRSHRETIDPKLEHEIVLNTPERLGVLSPSMWNLTFSTQIMRTHSFELPEHCLYTDSLFVAFHLPYVDSVVYLSTPLYHYCLSQSDDQSTSLRSVLAHIDDNYTVWDRMLDYIMSFQYGESVPPLILRRMRGSYNNAYQRTLMLPRSNHEKERIMKLEQDLKKKSAVIFRYMNTSRTIGLMRATHGLAYPLLCAYRKAHPYD